MQILSDTFLSNTCWREDGLRFIKVCVKYQSSIIYRMFYLKYYITITVNNQELKMQIVTYGILQSSVLRPFPP